MANDQIIPTEAAIKGCLDFVILSDGKEVDPSTQVVSIRINKKANKIPTAKLVVKDGSASSGTFGESNKDTFIPGKMIEVQAGRGGDSTTIFKGIAMKNGVKSNESGSQLNVECKDEAIKMTVGRKNKYFKNKKDSEIIKEVLDQYGLAGDIKETQLVHQQVIQHHSTDWDFILSRAEANGLVVIADDGKINVQSPEDAASPALSVGFGSTVVEFNAEMDASKQYDKVEASAWDAVSQGISKVLGSSSPLSEIGNIAGSVLSQAIGLNKFELRHSGGLLKEELQAWVDSTMLKSRLAKVKGSARFKGFGAIKPGANLSVGGIGERFGGNAFVSGIQQEFENGNWTTSADIGMDEDQWSPSDVAEKPAGGLVPPIQGLQIGTVMGLSGDAVQLRIPIIDSEEQGTDGRLAMVYAGAARGLIFRPEVGDEVIVGFVAQDPRHPVILGSLHSEANTAPSPLEGSDDNHIKGIVTRGNMRLIFDDEKNVATLWTPAGNQLELSEDGQSVTIKDQHNNQIILDKDGISITSCKDINITAPGKIGITSEKDSFSLSAKKDVSLNSGDGKFNAVGAKGVVVDSPDKTIIKGAKEVHLNPPNPPPKKKKEKPKELPKKTKSEDSGLVA